MIPIKHIQISPKGLTGLWLLFMASLSLVWKVNPLHGRTKSQVRLSPNVALWKRDDWWGNTITQGRTYEEPGLLFPQSCCGHQPFISVRAGFEYNSKQLLCRVYWKDLIRFHGTSNKTRTTFLTRFQFLGIITNTWTISVWSERRGQHSAMFTLKQIWGPVIVKVVYLSL